jgi:hypothetical protein
MARRTNKSSTRARRSTRLAAKDFATGAPSLAAPKLSSSHVASAALGSKSDTRAVPRVFEKPKERLHDRRGRPNAHMKIIEKEAQRRVDADELPRVRKLSVFARELCRWFSKTHPNLPQPKNPLSVANTIRKTWARRKSI